MRRERGHQHERAFHQLGDAGAVGLGSGDAFFGEADAGIADQPDGLEQIVCKHGLEYVEFEVSLRSRETYGRVVADDLRAHHRHGFALCRIDLAGHDG